METIKIETLDTDHKLEQLWEQFKADAKQSTEGTYIDVDNLTIRNAGLSDHVFASPNDFGTWRNKSTGSRYFLGRFGAGHARLFRR